MHLLGVPPREYSVYVATDGSVHVHDGSLTPMPTGRRILMTFEACSVYVAEHVAEDWIERHDLIPAHRAARKVLRSLSAYEFVMRAHPFGARIVRRRAWSAVRASMPDFRAMLGIYANEVVHDV